MKTLNLAQLVKGYTEGARLVANTGSVCVFLFGDDSTLAALAVDDATVHTTLGLDIQDYCKRKSAGTVTELFCAGAEGRVLSRSFVNVRADGGSANILFSSISTSVQHGAVRAVNALHGSLLKK